MGYMDPFFSGLDLQILVTLALVGLSWFLYYRVVRREFFRWWIWGWAALAGAAIFLRLFEGGVVPREALLLNVPLGLLQATFFGLSAETLRRRKALTRREVSTAVGVTVGLGLAVGLLPLLYSGAPDVTRALQGGPRHLALAVVFPYWAYMFVRSEESSIAVRTTVAGFGILGANQILYSVGAVGRITLEFSGVGFTGVGAYVTSPWAFLLDIAGQIAVSVGAGLLLIEGGAKAEKVVSGLRLRLEGLVEHSSDFIAFGTGKGGMEFVNDAGLGMVGLPETEYEGKSMFEFLDPTVREAFQEEVAPLLVEEGSWKGETRLRRFDDHAPIPVDASIFLVNDPDSGRPVATATICRDITERRRQEKALKEAMTEAEAANLAKSEFLATMSHEIRTPMNAIIGMAELLSDTELDGQQRDYVQVFRTAGDTLLRLINEVLDLSKIEAGRLELSERGFDLRELMDQTVQVFAVPAHTKGVEIAAHVDPDTPRWVVGDPDRLRQVLVNLLGNAVKFTDEGEVILEVEPWDGNGGEAPNPGADSRPIGLRFKVRDTGPGIPEEKLHTVFERFSQVDSSSTREHGGTGLGLTISAALVDLMGGEIGVESQVGKGSVFSFTARFGSEAAPERSRDVHAGDITDLRVLVVDDNATNRLILQETLNGWGALTRVAADGAEGLEELRSARDQGLSYDLVLLDAQMPGMDGFEVAQEIQEEENLSGPTLLMLTSAGSRDGAVSRARQAGIHRFMVKPIRRVRLLEAIRAALGKEGAAPEGDAAPQAEDPVEDAIPAEGRRILLVEDAAENRMLVQAYLKRTPHDVETVENGQEAVDAVQARHADWDLVLMDVQMPVMDGYEATRTIRDWEEEQGHHRLPIVALTAHALESERQKSADVGCDAHVTKPIKKKGLLEAIEEHARDRVGKVAG